MATSDMTLEDAAPRFRVTLRGVALVLVAVGLFVSGYLSYVHFSATPSLCLANSTFNCDAVLNSVYSELFGIKIAYLGFAMYAVVGALLLLEKQIAFLRDYGQLLVFGVCLFAWVFSMWLVYVQFALLQQLCPWCLTHEANMTILFGVVIVRLWRDLQGVDEKVKNEDA